MGNQEASPESKDSLGCYWQERPIKYIFPNGEILVEEVKTPWDIYTEGRWLGSPIGNEFHQILVKNGMERIFSIRNSKGEPYCEVLTRPKGAPMVNVDWASFRGLNTSSPMTIDDQKLIVLDVIGKGARRVDKPLMKLAQEFFVSQGGVLRNEHPNGLVFSEPKIVKQFQAILDKNVKIDLMISSKPIRGEDIRKLWRAHTAHATNLELALLLLSSRYWHRCHINGDEEWTSDVVAQMEDDKDDQPSIINIYGHSDHAKALFERVTIMYGQGEKK